MQAGRKKKGSPESERVAQKILDYFAQNPRAMDTTEGIAQWWVKSRIENVVEALELLIKGKLVRVIRIEGGTYYRIHEDHSSLELKKKGKRY